MPATLAQLAKDFLDYLEIEKNRSLLTRRNYEFYLGRFLQYANERGCREPARITADIVREYRLWLNRRTDADGTSLKRKTQNYHVIILRAFLKYLAKRDVKTLAAEKIELGKEEGRQIAFLEGEELRRLLDAPLAVKTKERKNERTKELSIAALRDKAILETLFSTGLRVAELARLRREDVNVKKGEFSVRGKGSKVRLVFLSPAAQEWLKKYIDARPDISPYLFAPYDRRAKKTDDKPLTSRSIQRIVEKYAKMAGITKNITPHTLRHSLATDLLKNGADIRSVQAILGHSSITTTQIYTHVTDQRLREVHEKYHSRKKS